MKKSVKIVVSGKVQAVGLREFVSKQAEKFEIQGTIQNSHDGTVVIYAQGTDDGIEDLIDSIYRGSPKSKVENVSVDIFSTPKDFRGVFRIIGEEKQK